MKKSIHTPEYDMLRAELARIRTAANLSQRQLAQRLKVPHSWVAKVESGERRIDVVELCWVLGACGLNPASSLEAIGKRLESLGSLRRGKKGVPT